MPVLPASLSTFISIFENYIETEIRSGLAFPNCLQEGCLYALGSGKRIRPFIICSLGSSLGIGKEQLYNWSLAVELLHCSTLVHDDMPMLDNDEERRGKPTVHIRYGEAEALLIGDALLAKSFGIGSRNKEVGNKLTALLSSVAVSIFEGQLLERAASESLSLEEYLRVISAKTASLFSVSLIGVEVIGFLGGHVSSCNNLNFGRLGELFGLLFQVVDDLDDWAEGDDASLNVAQILQWSEVRELLDKNLLELWALLQLLPQRVPALENIVTYLQQLAFEKLAEYSSADS